MLLIHVPNGWRGWFVIFRRALSGTRNVPETAKLSFKTNAEGPTNGINQCKVRRINMSHRINQ